MTQPLVSCIMPTSARLDCVAEALSQFLSQDYPCKELLILNDCPGRQLRMGVPGVTIVDSFDELDHSEKVARLVAASRGDYIAFWPEDSVSLPWRLSDSVARAGQSGSVGDWPAEGWGYLGRDDLQTLNSVADWTGLAGAMIRRDVWESKQLNSTGEPLTPSELAERRKPSPIPYADRWTISRLPLSLRSYAPASGEGETGVVDLKPRSINDPKLLIALEKLNRRHRAARRHRICPFCPGDSVNHSDDSTSSAVWLDTLTPVEATVGYGVLGIGGELGYESRVVEIRGNRPSHSLSAHGPSRLIFDLGGEYREFRCRVAMNDDVPAGETAADYLVLGDGELLAIAKGVRPQQVCRQLTADLTGVRQLGLVVRPHRWDWCHAVWVDPAITPSSMDLKNTSVIDCLGRADITVSQDLGPSELCVATVGSPGYETWIDDLLSSVRLLGNLADARLAIFFFGESPSIEVIAKKHGAIIIPCFDLLPVTAASKSVLYSVSRVIKANKYLCLDADLLVLNDLRPLIASLDTLAPEAILAPRDLGADAPLKRALVSQYGGNTQEVLGLIGVGDSQTPQFPFQLPDRGFDDQLLRGPLQVTDRVFAGSRIAFQALDDHLRSLVGADEWVDQRRLAKPARSRFVFNLVLANDGTAVELASHVLRPLPAQVTDFSSLLQQSPDETSQPETLLVHMPRLGPVENPQAPRLFRENFRKLRPPLRSARDASTSEEIPASTGLVSQIDRDGEQRDITSQQVESFNPLDCAVVIPCHNYGRFLADCLDSILDQARPAREILVVLDDCSDNSAEVVERYRDRGVRSLAVRCCDSYLARRAGLHATNAPIVCFLDADDRLSPDYLSTGIPLFERSTVGIVTAATHEFGNSTETWIPELGDIQRVNCVCSAALVRRLALIGTRAFEQLEGIGIFGEDWFVWRRVAQGGWEIAKSPAIHHYRRHDSNITLDCPEAWADRHRQQAKKTTRKKLRVGFLTDWLICGGVARHLQMLAGNCRNIEWKGVVVADEGGVDDTAISETQSFMPVTGGKPHQDSRFSSPLIHRRESAALALSELIRDIDVLYVNGAGLRSLLEPLAGSVPIVYSLHASGHWVADGARDVSSFASVLVGVAEACRECLPPIDRSRMRRISNGVDFSLLASPEPRWQVRGRWGISSAQIAVGFVGRWAYEKNPGAVADAVAALGPTATAVYCSPQCLKDEPPLDSTERRRISEITGGRVVWTWSATMGEVYRGLDCLVVPSHEEGGPLVAIEAFGTGCPLVSTSVGVLAELPPESGRLFVPVPHGPSGPQLAEAIREAISPENFSTTERAKTFAWNNWGVKRMACEWEAIFKLALGRDYANQQSAAVGLPA